MDEAVWDRPDLSAKTLRTYRSQWTQWVDWCERNGCEAFPADPERVAAYVADRAAAGNRPATVTVVVAAIAHVHTSHGLVSPNAHLEVQRALRGIRRSAVGAQKQARGLTAEHVEAIIATAFDPRPTRHGHVETARRAHERALRDIAIVRLMRDGMLRVGEAAAVEWRDINAQPDGTGRLLVRRSKTDPDGVGAVVFLSTDTMTTLGWIRGDASPTDRVLPLHPNQIASAIKEACAAAGLGDGFSGHSPRVGMAQDLARAGVDLPALMQAGRWSSPKMAARYIANESAGRGAVAMFAAGRRSSFEPPPMPDPPPRKADIAKPAVRAGAEQRDSAPQRKPKPNPKPNPKPVSVADEARRREAREARRAAARQRASAAT